MHKPALIHSFKARFGKSRWLPIGTFLGFMVTWRILEGENLLKDNHGHHIAVMVALFYLYALSPIPWQWTGDGRPMASLGRGVFQSLAFNVVPLILLVFLPLHLAPQLFISPKDVAHMAAQGIRIEAPAFAYWALLESLLAAILAGWLLARLEANRIHRQEAEETRRALEITARQAQFQALQAQLDPHVLYNSLSGIAELIHEDADRAERAVLGLSKLYRRITELGRQEQIPLAQERELISEYLALEQLRFEDRLKVQWDWPQAVDALFVPPLTLQPLVENAIKHGLSDLEAGGELRLSAHLDANGLVLSVANNGQPLKADLEPGTGLSNLRSRLALLGDDSRLELHQIGEWIIAEVHLKPHLAQD